MTIKLELKLVGPNDDYGLSRLTELLERNTGTVRLALGDVEVFEAAVERIGGAAEAMVGGKATIALILTPLTNFSEAYLASLRGSE